MAKPKCSKCRKSGHNKLTCKTKAKSKAKKIKAKSRAPKYIMPPQRKWDKYSIGGDIAWCDFCKMKYNVMDVPSNHARGCPRRQRLSCSRCRARGHAFYECDT